MVTPARGVSVVPDWPSVAGFHWKLVNSGTWS